MYKTLFQQHKETIIGGALIVSFLTLLIVNIMVMIPAIQATYNSSAAPVKQNPINTETVNSAIEYLSQ